MPQFCSFYRPKKQFVRSSVEVGYNFVEVDAIFSGVAENELLRDENDLDDLFHEMADMSFEADTMQCMLSSFLLR